MIPKADILKKISDIYDIYDNEEDVINKLDSYLSHIRLQINQYYESNKLKKEKLIKFNEEKEKFQTEFLQSNVYLFHPNVSLFYEYNGSDYNVISEDNILYSSLTTLNTNEILQPYKTKITNETMKSIKTRLLLKSIPNSVTIQWVLKLFYPRFFKNKNEVKYFLTVIGDNIFKNNTDLVHLYLPDKRDFINIINYYIQNDLKINFSFQNFKTKVTEADFSNCRIHNILDADINELDLKNNIIKIVCVSCHYSTRFKGSENYINNLSYETVNKINYVNSKTNVNNIIQDFVVSFIEKSEKLETSISWKNMLYLWKQFLDYHYLHNIISYPSLKSKLCEMIKYEGEKFLNVTSKHLPAVDSIIDFWKTNIEYCDDGLNEYDINELFLIYKSTNNYLNISKDHLLNIITYFYNDDIVIVNNKHILNIKCASWDKKKEICDFLKKYDQERINENKTEQVTFYDVYENYCNLFNDKQFIVTKNYFEKYLLYYYNNHINKDIILNSLWDNLLT